MIFPTKFNPEMRMEGNPVEMYVYGEISSLYTDLVEKKLTREQAQIKLNFIMMLVPYLMNGGKDDE